MILFCSISVHLGVKYSKNMEPLVSVIIPTYNRDYIVEVAIKSVLEQSYLNLELILVDDGSKDKTPYLVTKYPLKYVRLPKNFGPSFARNRGIIHAKGELIAFLDSDDYFLPSKIEKQVKFLRENPQYDIVQTEEIWYKGERRVFPKKIHAKAEGYFFDRAVKLCVVSISTVLLKRSVFERVGLFDENFPLCEDYEFWLRVALYYPMGLIKEPLVIKDGGRPDQLSQRKGLDFYRVKALLKILKEYNSKLEPEKRLLILGEAKKKTEIFLKGARKYGNIRDIYKLKKLWQSYNIQMLMNLR